VGAIDPDRLALGGTRPSAAATPPSRRAPRHGPGERFLRGPVPWSWLIRGARLPGRALQVGIALWHLSGLNGGAQTVVLSGAVLQELGVTRTTGYRALRTLEDAGLVAVDRHHGRLPRVTLLDAGGKR